MGGATLGSVARGTPDVRVQTLQARPGLMPRPLARQWFWSAGRSGRPVGRGCGHGFYDLAGNRMGPMYPTTTVIVQNAVLPPQFGSRPGTELLFGRLECNHSGSVRGDCASGSMWPCLAARSTKWLTRVRRQVSLHKKKSFGWSSWRLAFFLGLHVSQSRSSKERPLGGPYVRHGSRKSPLQERGGGAAPPLSRKDIRGFFTHS